MGRRRRRSYAPYVSVAEHKARAEETLEKRRKNGELLNPIRINGKNITHTFWGKAWCKHIEKFQDYQYRLERGRSYVRAGSVIDLTLSNGLVKAIVLGKTPYNVTIQITPLPAHTWQNILQISFGRIDSVIALLQGKFPSVIMEKMTDVKEGLFPDSGDISLACNCLDAAIMCKHVAATMYGIGNRLDVNPEALFTLRSVNHLDLMQTHTVDKLINQEEASKLDGDLCDIFGIELVN